MRASLVVVLVFASCLHAEQFKGSIRKWDAEKKSLTASIAGKDQELAVSDTVRVLDARGGVLKEGLRTRGLPLGSTTQFTTSIKDGKAEVHTIRLLTYYLPRPDSFYLDPEQAGPDFQIQGEYEGEIPGQGKLGAQVMTQDDGLFSVVFLPGGLPGAGADPKSKTVKAVAVTADGKTRITGSWSGEIAAGQLTGKTAGGVPFTLNRVIRKSPTLGAKPPGGPPSAALVLFDGTSTEHFTKARMSEGLLLVPATSKQLFKDFQLHVEFLIPYRGPSGGNSGVYLQNCYEIQVFDSFGRDRSPSGCGGIYVFRRPDVNVSFPPLSWQTFDVDSTAARFDAEGKMIKNPVVTVRHNGVVIHENLTLPEKGNGGRPTPQGGPSLFAGAWQPGALPQYLGCGTKIGRTE